MNAQSTCISASSLSLSQEALEAMPFPFAICTCDGLYVGANDLVEQLFHVPKTALIGHFNFLTDPVSQDNGSRALFLSAAAGQRGQAPVAYYDFSFPGTHSPERAGCWIETTFLPFRDGTGQVTHVGMLIQDVSERVASEQQTLRLTAMIENALDAVGTIDLDGKITYSNPAYLALTGYSIELIGKPITTIFADDSNTVISAVNQVVAQGQWQGRLTARRADGSSFPAEVSAFPLRDRTGEIIGIAATIRDLTERQAQEQRLRRLETLVENAPDAISITSPEGYLEYANAAYRTLFGDEDTIFQLSWQAFYPADVLPKVAAIGQELFTKGVWRGTIDQQDSSGRRFPVHLSTFLMRNEADAPTGFATILRDISAQQAHENRLRMFEALVENAAIGMAINDLEGTYIYANAALRDTYGYGENIIGMKIPETVAPEARASLAPTMAEMFSTGHTRVESRFICQDGSIRPVDVSALLIRDANGVPQATAAIIRDLVEERTREQELRMAKFSLDRSPDAIQWVDSSGRLVYVNDGTCTMLGYTRDELLQLKVADIDPVFPLDDFAAVWNQFKQDGNQKFETIHRRKDGTDVNIEIVSGFVEFEGNEYGCMFARDISERKRAEAEMRLMKLTLDRASDGVHWFAADFKVSYANDTACAMLGYSREEMLRMSLFDFIIGGTPEEMALAREVVKQQGTLMIESVHRHKDGREIPVEVVVNYLVFEGQEYNCTFSRDISERKRAEVERTVLQEQIIAAQQAALRELSTPLIPLADGVVAMPLIGSIDSSRAQLVIETLLNGTAELRAHTTIIDITGVPVVDTQVANALLRAAQAVRLLGARVILTGIRPEVAQTLVGLGIDLSGISTRGTLQSGIAEALGRGASVASNGRR